MRRRSELPAWWAMIGLLVASPTQGADKAVGQPAPEAQFPRSAKPAGQPIEESLTYREHVHSTEPDESPTPAPAPGASPTPQTKAPEGKLEIQAITIREPGPDLSNLPNSSYTLPKGGIYLEMSPFVMQGASVNSVKQYNWEILLRYGLTDDLELRLFTQGLTVQGPPQSATGFSPLTFDTKVHLSEDEYEYFNYSVGLEAYIQTTWGSPAFATGTQYSLMVNADHALPFEIALNWNFGFASLQDFRGAQVVLPSLQWAFQRDVVDDFALFIQGYINAAALPRTIHAGAIGPVQFLDQHAIGAGFQWTLNDRIAVFGSYNGALGSFVPDYLGTIGLAVAF